MKKLWVVLALMLLVGCVPVAVVPPTETTEPPPPTETTVPPLPPTETKLPPLVVLPAGNLPDAPYTPLAAPVRYYQETVLDLIPDTGYGRIFPYVGKGQERNLGYWDGYLTKYGLCTETGVIVCDPTYDSYTVYGDATGGMYALQRRPARAIEFGDSAWETTLAAFDGSWVLQAQDESECQYGATVKVDGLWGVWGYDGQWVLPPTYEGPLYFQCGLAPVVTADRERYYYIDITGQTVLGPYDVGNADFGWLMKVVSEDEQSYYYTSHTGDGEVMLGPYDIDYVPWDKLLGGFLSQHSFSNEDFNNVPRYFAAHNDGYLFQNGDILDERIYYLSLDPDIFWYTVDGDNDPSWLYDVVLHLNGAETIYKASRNAQYIDDGGGRIIIDHFSEGGNTVLDTSGNTLFSIPSGELYSSGGYYYAASGGMTIVYDINFNELFRTDKSISRIGDWFYYFEEGRSGIMDERGEVLLPAIYDELSEVNGMLNALRGTRAYLFDANLNCVLALDITDGG